MKLWNLWNLLDITASHELANALPKLGNASWFPVYCAIPPTDIYRELSCIAIVGELEREKSKELDVRRGETHTQGNR